MICPQSEMVICREPASGHPDALRLNRWDGPQTLCTLLIFTQGQPGSNMLPRDVCWTGRREGLSNFRLCREE